MKLKFFAACLFCGSVFCASAQQKKASQGHPRTESSKATVLFSRSDDQTASSAASAARTQQPAVKLTDADRAAITATTYDLDVHLALRDHALSARARLKLRNDGAHPLSAIPLQISSSLNFQGAELNGKLLPFTQQTLNSDTDHTGQLHEAVIQLPQPLAPGASVGLTVAYGGEITLDAKRLVQLGTPENTADTSDWDRISEDFTGLRGFGNVVWYPVASIPALLGDGDKVFSEIGREKQRESGATIAIRLTVEYFLAPPSVIVLDWHAIHVPKPSVTPTSAYPGVVTVTLPATKIGFAAPSLLLADWPEFQGSGVTVFARTEDQLNAQALISAAKTVQPLIAQWLGPKPKSTVTVIDLPEPGDLTWEQGSLLATAISKQKPDDYTEMLSHALARAYFQSPREWLNEGVATFIETLWIEHASDRDHALASLESQRGALALTEPATPGDSPGESLMQASDPIYYRTKAAYVLWMLREMVGDKQLAAALASYDPAADVTPDYFQKLVENAPGLHTGKDLQWFFDNWVYHDRGLPDLSIAAFHATPSPNHAGLYLVSVDIMNSGFADAEVPVTVRSATSTLTERVLLPGNTRTVHRMLVQGIPDQVIVNDGATPEVAADIHRRKITGQ